MRSVHDKRVDACQSVRLETVPSRGVLKSESSIRFSNANETLHLIRASSELMRAIVALDSKIGSKSGLARTLNRTGLKPDKAQAPFGHFSGGLSL